jgi:hypothetical protein
LKQRAVSNASPTLFDNRTDLMTGEEPLQPAREGLIKEYLHGSPPGLLFRQAR